MSASTRSWLHIAADTAFYRAKWHLEMLLKAAKNICFLVVVVKFARGKELKEEVLSHMTSFSK